VGKVRTLLVCRDCGQQLARWAGRCPGCGGWGTIEERAATEMAAGGVEVTVLVHDGEDRQVSALRTIDAVGVDVRRQGSSARSQTGDAVRREERGGIASTRD